MLFMLWSFFLCLVIFCCVLLIFLGILLVGTLSSQFPPEKMGICFHCDHSKLNSQLKVLWIPGTSPWVLAPGSNSQELFFPPSDHNSGLRSSGRTPLVQECWDLCYFQFTLSSPTLGKQSVFASYTRLFNMSRPEPCLLFTTWLLRPRKPKFSLPGMAKPPSPPTPSPQHSTYSPSTCMDSVRGLRIPFPLISSLMPSKRSFKCFTQYFSSFQW